MSHSIGHFTIISYKTEYIFQLNNETETTFWISFIKYILFSFLPSFIAKLRGITIGGPTLHQTIAICIIIREFSSTHHNASNTWIVYTFNLSSCNLVLDIGEKMNVTIKSNVIQCISIPWRICWFRNITFHQQITSSRMIEFCLTFDVYWDCSWRVKVGTTCW